MEATLTAVAEFINRVGFPVAVAIILLWQVERMHKSNTDLLNIMVEELKGLRYRHRLKMRPRVRAKEKKRGLR